MSRTTMETYSGVVLDFANLRPEDINLRDVAKALSLTCRFGGHIPRFYSVAEHALLVAELVREFYERPDLAYAALHHDSHEAYIGDIPTPLKAAAGEGFKRLANELDHVIAKSFGIDPLDFDNPVIKEADEFALWIEARQLKPSCGSWWNWSWQEPPSTSIRLPRPRDPEYVVKLFVREHTRAREPQYA